MGNPLAGERVYASYAKEEKCLARQMTNCCKNRMHTNAYATAIVACNIFRFSFFLSLFCFLSFCRQIRLLCTQTHLFSVCETIDRMGKASIFFFCTVEQTKNTNLHSKCTTLPSFSRHAEADAVCHTLHTPP